MTTKVQRWGNSLALRLPKAFARELRVESGSDVELELRDGALVVRPGGRRRYRLADLLAGVTSANRHDEVSSGRPRGKEPW